MQRAVFLAGMQGVRKTFQRRRYLWTANAPELAPESAPHPEREMENFPRAPHTPPSQHSTPRLYAGAWYPEVPK